MSGAQPSLRAMVTTVEAACIQPTSKQAEKAQSAQPAKPEGAQAPAKSMQVDGSGADQQGGGKMSPDAKPAKVAGRGKSPRERGQEEAGESDSGLGRGTPGLLLTLDDLHNFHGTN